MKSVSSRNRLAACAAVGLLCAAAAAARAATVPFTPGDIVVYQVGDGSTALGSSAAPVFLDEYTTSGALVLQIAMPTTSVAGANQMLTDSSASSDGEITLSPNGQYLTLTGYDAAVGTTKVVSGTTPRTIGIIAANGVVDTTTAASIYSGNNIRSAVTTDGNQIWTAGSGSGVGIYSLAKGSTAASVLNTSSSRQVAVFNGQLYFDSTSLVYSLGSGLPTSGSPAATALPGVSTGSPYNFFFASVKPASNGAADTLYIADSVAGIIKYNLIGSNWVKEGTVGGSSNAFTGLTGQVLGGTVNLFATANNNTLVSLTDSSGFGNTFTSPITTVAIAAANEQFDGVAFAPVAPATTVPLPAALPLLVSGLGLLSTRRRRKKFL